MDNLIPEVYEWAKKNPAVVISGLSLVVAALSFLLTHSTRLRAAIRHTVLSIGGRLGFTRAKYTAAFLKTHRELRNIYLDRIEKLDIVATYVPLNVLSETGSHVNQPAIDVLLDPSQDRIVILGDPGSGKTTLLKSFGVSLVSNDYHRKHQGRKGQEAKASPSRYLTPVYVELRDFASQLAKYPTLAEYIVGHTLSRHLDGSDGQGFLQRLLLNRECVVLLDALDEVGEDEYEAVRQAIHVFLSETREALPTANARVVLTSRHQNFLNIYGDWVPSAFPRYFVLSPFSDDDIQRFLNNRASDLPSGKTPTALWEEIRDSNTLDLHRTPLILTVSLGLYKIIPRYTIPESVARFYEEITKELLQRHDFRTRPYLSKRNVFPSEFKLQFLREFALKSATRPGRFDEFSYGELSEAFNELCRRNARLSADDHEKFLQEIIDNAGLLRRVSDSGTYVFAHRSFHEYFAALQLSKTAEQGAAELIERAENLLWRQVTIFFAALDHDRHDTLLRGLAARNPELAGYALAVTINVSPEVARLVVERLGVAAVRSNAVSILGALSAICRNAGREVREQSLDVIGRILSQVLVLEDTTALIGLTRDDLLSLTRNLAAAGARNIVNSCVTLSRLVEDDHRVVAPLWTCLGYFVDESNAAEANQLVRRLLELAQTHEGLAVLQAGPPLSPAFATVELRASAYPFAHGAGRGTNLVTLLTWAHYIDAIPEKRNGFLLAFEERKSAALEWHGLERELAKTPIVIRPYLLGLLLFWGGAAACFAYLLWSYFAFGGGDFAARHFTFFESLLPRWATVVGIGLAVGILVGSVMEFLAPLGSQFSLAHSVNPRPANPIPRQIDKGNDWLFTDGTYFWDRDTSIALLILAFVQAPFILTGAGLVAGGSVSLKLASASLLSLVCFWLPATQMFSPEGRIDLRRRGRLASLILADSTSQLWLQKGERTTGNL